MKRIAEENKAVSFSFGTHSAQMAAAKREQNITGHVRDRQQVDENKYRFSNMIR